MILDNLNIIAFVMQVLVVIFSIRIGKILGKTSFWTMITLALTLGPLRRIITFLQLNGILSVPTGNWIDLIDTFIIPFTASVLLLIGFYSLYERLKLDTIEDKLRLEKRKKR